MTLGEGLRERQQAREELCRRFLVMVKERLPQAELEKTGPMQYRVRGPGLQESTLLLENLFRQLDALEPEEAESLVQRHVASLVSSAERAEDPVRREQIVPMIKDQTYLDQLGSDLQLVKEHLTADLWIVYAADLPTDIMTVSQEQVEELGLLGGALRATAVSNLRVLLPPIETFEQETWFLITDGSGYTASTLLLDEVWEEFANDVQGDLVVAVPTRDTLLVTGSASAKGIAAVRAKAAELEQAGSYAISQTLLRRRQGRWVALS